MKKKTAIVIFLCFVCVAVIGICAMAGISKWQEYQTAQQRQQQLDAYVNELGSAFDDLYAVETGLLENMAQQSTAGVSNRDILLNAIEAVGEPMDKLASAQAPEEVADAQRHFATAAESCHTMSEQLTALLQEDTQNPEQLRDTCSHKFRDARDISQFAVKFYQLMQGQFHPYDKHKFGVALPAEPNVDRICQIIRQRQYKALCINDGDMADFAGCRDRINAAFADALPNKSSFER